MRMFWEDYGLNLHNVFGFVYCAGLCAHTLVLHRIASPHVTSHHMVEEYVKASDEVVSKVQ